MSKFFKIPSANYSIGGEGYRAQQKISAFIGVFFMIAIIATIFFYVFFAVAILLLLYLIYFLIKKYMQRNKRSNNRSVFYPKDINQNSTLTITKHNSSSIFGADFISRRNYLEETFPNAYEFLYSIKSKSRVNFWLGTSVNAHLYFNDHFFAFLKIKPNSLIFSPHFNGRIAGGTINSSYMLFPLLFRKIIQSQNGFDEGWAIEFNNGTFEVFSKAPSSFFYKLKNSITSIS